MLYWLSQWLTQFYHGFQVFRYLTLRGILATLTALLVAWLLAPLMIKLLRRLQIGQMVRDDGPKRHLDKSGTPTMGGVLIVLAILIATLLWADLSNLYVWLALIVLLGFAVIGFIDDYLKLVRKASKGLSARQKLLCQIIIALFIAGILYHHASIPIQTELVIPFFKHIYLHLGWFFIVFVVLVIVGSSNAVNLTDGLDGLAIMPTILVGGALGIFAYVTGNEVYASYLAIPFIPGAGELVVMAAALFGAGLGFLWFNTYPAQVFMGDVGSLGLGALLGILAVMVRQEIVLFIMGGIFVVETLSVMLQVASFRLTGKRIFKMAPLHHHFELKGWSEPKIIVRFWIITVVLVLIGLATLKVR